MELLAADSKEFKRASVTRSPENTATVKDPRAFYTQLGVAVLLPDPERFRDAFVSAFIRTAEKHRVTLPRQFGSSRFVIESIFDRRYNEARRFMYEVLEQTQDLIRHIDVTWLIASPLTTPTVTVGGMGSAQRSIPLKEFVTNAGNTYSMISGWVYTQVFRDERPTMELDNFQGKPSAAWDQLSSSGRPLQVFQKGDECNPFICMADILAYLTDRGLHAVYKSTGRGKLFPDDVKSLWSNRPFTVRAGYLDPEVFPDIAPINDSPIPLSKWYPTGMTYFLIDQGLLNDMPTKPPASGIGGSSEEAITFRNFLENSGLVNAPLLSAQLDRTGFKFFNAYTDSEGIHEGDRLVYMGKTSKSRAEIIESGIRVKVESMIELRDRLRARGYDC
jgi:hypothetical protein